MLISDLYQSCLIHTRYFPILPEDCDPSHMPTVPKDWHNNHQGLYSLDHLENVADSPWGKQLLCELSQVPGIRLLASSQVSLEGVWGRSIPVGRLDCRSCN